MFSELLAEAETGTFTEFVPTPTRRQSNVLPNRG